MFARRSRVARTDCQHGKTVTVANAGIERSICEACGHVSFQAREGLSGSARRSQFERIAERADSMAG